VRGAEVLEVALIEKRDFLDPEGIVQSRRLQFYWSEEANAVSSIPCIDYFDFPLNIHMMPPHLFHLELFRHHR